MIKHAKIKSFTLSEMIVVLVITSIVVGLAFSILNLAQRQMKGVAENYAGTTQLQLLEQSLWADFHRYQTISYDPGKEELQFKHELDSVHYRFEPDKIIKDKDTFFITIENKIFYDKGNVTAGGVLDAVKLQTTAEQQAKKLFIFKKNDATNTLNSWHFN